MGDVLSNLEVDEYSSRVDETLTLLLEGPGTGPSKTRGNLDPIVGSTRSHVARQQTGKQTHSIGSIVNGQRQP